MMRTPFFQASNSILGVEKKEAERADNQDGKGNGDNGHHALRNRIFQNILDRSLGYSKVIGMSLPLRCPKDCVQPALLEVQRHGRRRFRNECFVMGGDHHGSPAPIVKHVQ